MKKPNINPALHHDALYAKSQVYIRRGLRAQSDMDLEEYQLWASLSLELLGKAALSTVHPALVADPTHYQSLFAACGRELSPDIKTITAKTVFERLSHIEKKFDSRHQKFCEQMALRRNAELHSGESPFSGMSADAWEREFWGAVDIVLKMQDENLESWLGAEDSKAPAKIVEQAEQATKLAVTNRIFHCKEDFEKANNAAKRAHLIDESKKFHYWKWPESRRLISGNIEGHACPACGGMGMMSGIQWDEEVTEDQGCLDEDGYPIETVVKTYSVEEFLCHVCNFHLYGIKEVAAARLPEEFTRTEERERNFGPEYGND